MKALFLLFFTLPFIVSPNQTYAQSVLYGSPLMDVYTKKDYAGAAQNWEVDVMNSGRVCFANSYGLLLFDGTTWELCRVKSAPILRTLKCDGDSIFVGGYNTIGYFKNVSGEWKYHSLMDEAIDDEIWKIERLRDKVFFQSFSAMYIWSEGKLQQYDFEKPIAYCSSSDYGVMYTQGDKLLRFYDKEEQIAQLNKHVNRVHGIVYEEENTLIATQTDGLFIMKGEQAEYLNNELSSLLKRVGVNKVFPINDKLIAFATYRGGVVLADYAYNIIRIIDQHNRLPNNRVHGVAYQAGLLWIATDNGLAAIAIENDVELYRSASVGMGTSYDIASVKDDLYVGTNQGLYHLSGKNSQAKSYAISKVDAVSGQVWGLFTLDNSLFCSLDDGVYELNDNKIKFFANVRGGRHFQVLNFNSNVAIQGTFEGLVAYEKINGKWSLLNDIVGLKGHIVVEIIQGYQRNLWVKTFQGEFFRVRLAANGKIAERIEPVVFAGDNYSGRLSMFEIDGTPMFLKEGEVFCYVGGQYVKSSNIKLKNVTYVSSSFGKSAVVKTTMGCYMYNLADESSVRLTKGGAEPLDKLVYNYENIVSLSNGQVGICTEDGFILVSKLEDLGAEVKYNPIEIERVEYRNLRSETKTKKYGGTEDMTFPRGARYLVSVKFSSFNFDHDAMYEYTIKRNGELIEQAKTKESKIDITSRGHGVFDLRIAEIGSDKPPVNLTFEVSTPILMSNLAKFAYGATIITLIYLTIVGFKKRELRKQRLEEQRLQREVSLLQEKQEYEERLILMKKMVAEREGDLTYLATRVLKNKGILSSVLNLFSDSADQEGTESLKKRFGETAKEFDSTENEVVKDWELFEHGFTKANPEFYDTMRKKHPNLTDGDLRLCMYIKAGLMSKEIAPLFHITVKSLELKRYRMRRKLNISSNISLAEYLSNL